MKAIQSKAILAGFVLFLIAYWAFSFLGYITGFQETAERIQWLYLLWIVPIYLGSGFLTGRLAPNSPVAHSAFVGVLASSVDVVSTVSTGAPIAVIISQVLPPVSFACIGGLVAHWTATGRSPRRPTS